LAFDIRTGARVERAALDTLWRAAWGEPVDNRIDAVLSRSLVYVCAFGQGRLVGFVNVAGDGGKHAFLLDPTVHPDCRRQGLGAALVAGAASEARKRGATWLHVDFVPELEGFYAKCGFRPTSAGLIDLRKREQT